MSVSLERIYRIWDGMGYFIQISEDSDGLGMMEISYWESESQKVESVNIPSDMFEFFLTSVREFVMRSKDGNS